MSPMPKCPQLTLYVAADDDYGNGVIADQVIELQAMLGTAISVRRVSDGKQESDFVFVPAGGLPRDELRRRLGEARTRWQSKGS